MKKFLYSVIVGCLLVVTVGAAGRYVPVENNIKERCTESGKMVGYLMQTRLSGADPEDLTAELIRHGLSEENATDVVHLVYSLNLDPIEATMNAYHECVSSLRRRS